MTRADDNIVSDDARMSIRASIEPVCVMRAILAGQKSIVHPDRWCLNASIPNAAFDPDELDPVKFVWWVNQGKEDMIFRERHPGRPLGYIEHRVNGYSIMNGLRCLWDFNHSLFADVCAGVAGGHAGDRLIQCIVFEGIVYP